MTVFVRWQRWRCLRIGVWWSRYLAEEGYNSLTFPWIKPLHEIYFVPGIWSPTTVWNECLVDVRRMSV